MRRRNAAARRKTISSLNCARHCGLVRSGVSESRTFCFWHWNEATVSQVAVFAECFVAGEFAQVLSDARNDADVCFLNVEVQRA